MSSVTDRVEAAMQKLDIRALIFHNLAPARPNIYTAGQTGRVLFDKKILTFYTETKMA
jgi:hypothetical protein